jgi:hypothetical protein
VVEPRDDKKLRPDRTPVIPRLDRGIQVNRHNSTKLDPVVKPRDDKKLRPDRTPVIPRLDRGIQINRHNSTKLDPVVEPRDDKFAVDYGSGAAMTALLVSRIGCNWYYHEMTVGLFYAALKKMTPERG